MVKDWVYRKAFRLYEEGHIIFSFSDRNGNSYFNVEDGEGEDVDELLVKIGQDLEEHCDCMHGLTDGVNNKRCPHKLAVNLFIYFEIIKGDLSSEYIREDSSKREVEVDNVKADKELSSRQKKVLRNIMTCEICGSDDSINLHRLNRKGLYVLRNIMPVCGDCHRSIHSKEKGHTNK